MRITQEANRLLVCVRVSGAFAIHWLILSFLYLAPFPGGMIADCQSGMHDAAIASIR